MLNNSSILITGGTGSYGRALIDFLLKNKKIRRLVIFSRDELKQYELKKLYSDKRYSNLRFFLGDIRDKDRLKRALVDIDYVFHAAALKQVDTAEYNPFEFVKTNIVGSQNLIDAALDSQVKKILALSTDKASSPINLYGATKLCSDKLFISANNITGRKDIKFSVLRYGNVMFSRGSILPLLLNRYFDNKKFEITDKRMTRFNIELDQAIKLSINCFKNMSGGELYVPKLKSYKVIDLANAINSEKKIKIIGIRPGEKIHEEMISNPDSYNTFMLKDLFIIVDPSNKKLIKKYSKLKMMSPNTSYNSYNNPNYLSKSDLKKIINRYKNLYLQKNRKYNEI